ncbi:hypothetical protein BV898_03720 [Hypsibius exemplaris]|uniref:Uncharacterized protein n=1 Tax=Hypsibius exemplaris TaxID=2072580 RepID=A0A1W0X465_HYPEX|nr:hypothetical protein BV898_03720 [Hypsibius exemplaris]
MRSTSAADADDDDHDGCILYEVSCTGEEEDRDPDRIIGQPPRGDPPHNPALTTSARCSRNDQSITAAVCLALNDKRSPRSTSEVADQSDPPQGMSGGADVLQENASQDEIQAFAATKRSGRRNAMAEPTEFDPAQVSEDILPDLAKQLSLSDDPMDQSKSKEPQPSTSKQS